MKTIPLTQGQVALVDDEDFEWLNQWQWHAVKKYNMWYAIRDTRRKTKPRCVNKPAMIRMHDLLIQPPVDHKNRNGLDNRKENLRTVTASQNQQNSRSFKGSSKYKGVCWHKQAKKWVAYITYNYKHIHLGCFDSEIKAAKAYDKAARYYFGEFAYLNFPNWQKKEVKNG